MRLGGLWRRLVGLGRSLVGGRGVGWVGAGVGVAGPAGGVGPSPMGLSLWWAFLAVGCPRPGVLEYEWSWRGFMINLLDKKLGQIAIKITILDKNPKMG